MLYSASLRRACRQVQKLFCDGHAAEFDQFTCQPMPKRALWSQFVEQSFRLLEHFVA
jgi:hypothetical protein